MIGTIRKHSKWLWWVIAGLTIISFIYWGVAPTTRNSGVGGSGGFGTLYGHKITQQDYISARNEFFLFYWFNNHEWPDKNPNIKQKDLDEQIYLRMMLTLKTDALGIQVSEEAAAKAAGNLLRSPALEQLFRLNGQPVPIESFVKQVLAPAGLTADDLERFARSDVAIQELMQTVGMAGTLITPQEVAAAFQRDHQEVSAQFVLFSASNFVSQVSVTPAAIAQFYTNYLAQYRLPDRVQVNYVEFNLSNYLEQAKAKLPKTNLDNLVDMNYRQLGPDYFPDAKTPEAAKAKIREIVFQQAALADAKTAANEFATEVFNLNPVRPDNLATVAKQKGLMVHLTAPFSGTYGPEEFTAPAAFTKTAFALTGDEPIAGPVAGTYAYYVMALAMQLPSEIPPLDQMRDRVTQDYRMTEAGLFAQHAGTNFEAALNGQLMAGHTFASTCIAAGLQPVTLPTFSLSTQDLPELANQVELSQFLRIVANTPTAHASPFVPTADGGLIVYVQSRLPVDQATMSAGLPQFTAMLRRQREREAFNQWVQTEANRELRTTPVYLQQAAAGTK